MDTIVKALNQKVEDGNATTVVEALKQIDPNATGDTIAEVISTMELGGGSTSSSIRMAYSSRNESTQLVFSNLEIKYPTNCIIICIGSFANKNNVILCARGLQPNIGYALVAVSSSSSSYVESTDFISHTYDSANDTMTFNTVGDYYFFNGNANDNVYVMFYWN